MIREFVLQMKLGQVHSAYFQHKFGVDVQQRFNAELRSLEEQGFLSRDSTTIRLNRDGLLQVDRLLFASTSQFPVFIEPPRKTLLLTPSIHFALE